MHYQSERVPRSLTSTGRVGTRRDLAGSDGEFFGVDPVPTPVDIVDGRGAEWSMDVNGFCLVDHAWSHINYFDNSAILNSYYSECEALIARQTGASRVVAFDHNLRATQRKARAEGLDGGNAVQEPLISYGVHNDYTVTSAPRRIEQLSRPLGANDTLHGRAATAGRPPIGADELPRLLGGRWCFVNVWRNVSTTPVESFPLAAPRV